MPREKINNPRSSDFVHWKAAEGEPTPKAWLPDSEPGRQVDPDSAVAQVSWLKDSWVQLAIEADVSYLQFAADTPDGEPLTSDSQRSTVYTPPLSRDEVNHMIRTLRRARDQVFGRDE